MVYTDSEGMNAGNLQHVAFSKDPNPTGHRNGQDSRVLVECIPSGGRGITGSKSMHNTDRSTGGLQAALPLPI